MRPRMLVILLLLGCFQSLLFATVTAVYIPENQITLSISPGPYTSDSVLGAKLGTFVITATDGEIYSPSLVNIGEASDGIPVTGLMKNYANGPYELGTNTFYIMSVAYPNGLGGEPVLQTLYNNLWPIISWSDVTVYQPVLYVEMYLVNTNKTNRHAQSLYRYASYFKLDSPFTLPSGFNPRFSIAVAQEEGTNVGSYTNADGTVVETQGDYVVTDGVDGPDSTPIIGTGGYTNPEDPGSPGFYYGDVPLVPTFLFHFFDADVHFSLESALGSNRVTVNQAMIQIENGVAGETYEQTLVFSDTSTAPEFQLFPVDGPGNPISYFLFLGNSPITKGVPMLWTGLQPNANSQDLKIGGISENAVSLLASGSYRGTITVTITNPN